jgi:hypothetical protein
MKIGNLQFDCLPNWANGYGFINLENEFLWGFDTIEEVLKSKDFYGDTKAIVKIANGIINQTEEILK